MDNVRTHLNKLNPNDLHYMGRYYVAGDVSFFWEFTALTAHPTSHRTNSTPLQAHYYSGGPGIIISRGALRKLGSEAKKNLRIFAQSKRLTNDGERVFSARIPKKR